MGTPVDLLVVHAISLPPGVFGGRGVDDLFLGTLDAEAHPYYRDIAGLRVAAHFFIQRPGSLTQYVPVLWRAWHAGVSQWQGRERCNDFSIGVELEGDEKNPFEPVQYQVLAQLVRMIQTRHAALTDDRIVGHQDVAPGRKWDPGPGFDWPLFRGLLDRTTPSTHWPVVWS